MTSLRKLDVSSTHGPESCRCFSQSDNTLLSQVALLLSVELQKVTMEEIGLTVVLVTLRTRRTLGPISRLRPGLTKFALMYKSGTIRREVKPLCRRCIQGTWSFGVLIWSIFFNECT